MADKDNNFKEVISSLLSGMENVVSTKTVVGQDLVQPFFVFFFFHTITIVEKS